MEATLPMTDGSQNDLWRTFYEEAWEFRMGFMDDLMRRGETCPHRIIQSFQNHERKFQTTLIDGEIRWTPVETDGTRGDLLPTGFPAFEPTILRGNYVSLPYYTNDEFFRLIVDVLDGEAFDCVIELGSGYGKNLIEVFYNGGPKSVKYIGAELTDSGCDAMRRLFALLPEGLMEARKFDFLEPDFSFLEPYKKVLFFTVYAIQQVHQIPANLIAAMASAADHVQAVHIEPFGFQIEPGLGEGTADHVRFIQEKQWNINLGPMLAQAHNSGIIRLTHMAAEILGGGRDPASLAVWEGGRKA